MVLDDEVDIVTSPDPGGDICFVNLILGANRSRERFGRLSINSVKFRIGFIYMSVES
jgi:hypothetical protein